MGHTYGHPRSGPPDAVESASATCRRATRKGIPPRPRDHGGDDAPRDPAAPGAAGLGRRANSRSVAAGAVAEPAANTGADPAIAHPVAASTPDPSAADPAADTHAARPDTDDLDPSGQLADRDTDAADTFPEPIGIGRGRRPDQLGHTVRTGGQPRSRVRWPGGSRLGRTERGRVDGARRRSFALRDVRPARAHRRRSGHAPAGNPGRAGRHRCGLVAGYPSMAQSPGLMP